MKTREYLQTIAACIEAGVRDPEDILVSLCQAYKNRFTPVRNAMDNTTQPHPNSIHAGVKESPEIYIPICDRILAMAKKANGIKSSTVAEMISVLNEQLVDLQISRNSEWQAMLTSFFTIYFPEYAFPQYGLTPTLHENIRKQLHAPAVVFDKFIPKEIKKGLLSQLNALIEADEKLLNTSMNLHHELQLDTIAEFNRIIPLHVREAYLEKMLFYLDETQSQAVLNNIEKTSQPKNQLQREVDWRYEEIINPVKMNKLTKFRKIIIRSLPHLMPMIPENKHVQMINVLRSYLTSDKRTLRKAAALTLLDLESSLLRKHELAPEHTLHSSIDADVITDLRKQLQMKDEHRESRRHTPGHATCVTLEVLAGFGTRIPTDQRGPMMVEIRQALSSNIKTVRLEALRALDKLFELIPHDQINALAGELLTLFFENESPILFGSKQSVNSEVAKFMNKVLTHAAIDSNNREIIFNHLFDSLMFHKDMFQARVLRYIPLLAESFSDIQRQRFVRELENICLHENRSVYGIQVYAFEALSALNGQHDPEVLAKLTTNFTQDLSMITQEEMLLLCRMRDLLPVDMILEIIDHLISRLLNPVNNQSRLNGIPDHLAQLLTVVPEKHVAMVMKKLHTLLADASFGDRRATFDSINIMIMRLQLNERTAVIDDLVKRYCHTDSVDFSMRIVIHLFRPIFRFLSKEQQSEIFDLIINFPITNPFYTYDVIEVVGALLPSMPDERRHKFFDHLSRYLFDKNTSTALHATAELTNLAKQPLFYHQVISLLTDVIKKDGYKEQVKSAACVSLLKLLDIMPARDITHLLYGVLAPAMTDLKKPYIQYIYDLTGTAGKLFNHLANINLLKRNLPTDVVAMCKQSLLNGEHRDAPRLVQGEPLLLRRI